MNPWFVLLVLFPMLSFSVDAQEIGTLSLREGPLRVIRGAALLQGVEGMRLRQGDILESSDAGFAQLEFSGGAIVALGASSKLFLFSHPTDKGGGKATAELILRSGWLKAETSSGRTYRYVSPLLAATTKDGAVILHVSADTAEIFVESGSAGVSEVNAEGNLGAATTAKSGLFFSRRAGKAFTSKPRPDSSFIDSMPVPFRDTLPSRMSRFTGKSPEPKRDHEVSYSDVERWLNIAPAWRKDFVERFRPRLKDPAFRQAIEDHLGSLPDWGPVLNPEKDKTAPQADKPDSTPGRYP